VLVLADRNFYSYQAWQQASATGAALLWRMSGRLPLPALRSMPDGSYRSLLINPKIRGSPPRDAHRRRAETGSPRTPIPA